MSNADLPRLGGSGDATATTHASGKVYINWTDHLELYLVNSALKHKAYKRTEIKKDDKWNNVASDIIVAFLAMSGMIKGTVAKKKFERMWDDCGKKYALTEEGANLSGLPDKASPVEKILISMIIEVEKTKTVREQQNEKEKKRERSMMGIEKTILTQHQVIITPSAAGPSLTTPLAATTATAASSLAKEDAHLADFIHTGGANIDYYNDKENENNNKPKKKKRGGPEEDMFNATDPDKFVESLREVLKPNTLLAEQKAMDLEFEREKKNALLKLDIKEREERLKNESLQAEAMTVMADAVRKLNDVVAYLLSQQQQKKEE